MPALTHFTTRILLLGCVLTTVYLLVICRNDSVLGPAGLDIVGLDLSKGKMRIFPTYPQAGQAALGFLGVWAGWGGVGVEGQFSAPPGVDTWCGKAYRAT